MLHIVVGPEPAARAASPPRGRPGPLVRSIAMALGRAAPGRWRGRVALIGAMAIGIGPISPSLGQEERGAKAFELFESMGSGKTFTIGEYRWKADRIDSGIFSRDALPSFATRN